jgi:hypothetical protein
VIWRFTVAICSTGFARERLDDLTNHLRVDQRLVALHVHDDAALQIDRDFGDPIESTLMHRARHPRDSTKPLDGLRNPRIIGGNDRGINARRRCRTPIDVLDHRSAGDLCEWFAWESG